ncbi:hypothetical protein L195_g064033, partial [Trifolium pratense]
QPPPGLITQHPNLDIANPKKTCTGFTAILVYVMCEDRVFKMEA